MPDLLAPEELEFAHSPAFPSPEGAEGGITVRDWIAAMALQGYSVNGLEIQADRHMSQHERDVELAKRAFGLADAFIATRSHVAVDKVAQSVR